MAMDTNNDITSYLKMAVDLESSVFCQEEAIKEADMELQRKRPIKKDCSKPIKKAIEKPVRQKYERPKQSVFLILVNTFFLGAGILILFLSADHPYATSEKIFGLVIAIIGGLFLWAMTIGASKQAKEASERNERQYQEELKKYNKELEKIEEQYKSALEYYEYDQEQAEKAYQHELSVFNDASSAVSLLSPPLNETKNTLEKLYSNDWIFPKYRNMVAVCTFYEYFMSGRCSELTGPDGAYNLYEAELRQNLIINKLDKIVSQLEDIKRNQYTLYSEMKRARETVEGIGADVAGILSETIKIADASNITAQCARVAVQNTEAIKYISLINR